MESLTHALVSAHFIDLKGQGTKVLHCFLLKSKQHLLMRNGPGPPSSLCFIIPVSALPTPTAQYEQLPALLWEMDLPKIGCLLSTTFPPPFEHTQLISEWPFWSEFSPPFFCKAQNPPALTLGPKSSPKPLHSDELKRWSLLPYAKHHGSKGMTNLH